jgi:hypothetical protein
VLAGEFDELRKRKARGIEVEVGCTQALFGGIHPDFVPFRQV